MANYALNEWISTEDYLIRVEEVKEEMVFTGRANQKKEVRSVRILVSYKNRKNIILKHLCLQWLLYDTDGFNYDSEITRYFYGDDASRKLQEGHIGFGKQAKGWVAFKVPEDAVLDYVQFRPDYMSKNIVTISLTKPSVAIEKEPDPTSDSGLQKAWKKRTNAALLDDFADLQTNGVYRCKKPILDFYGNVFSPGDRLTFKRHYPLYYGLLTLVFKEATLYLHEEEHAEIMVDWERFFEFES